MPEPLSEQELAANEETDEGAREEDEQQKVKESAPADAMQAQTSPAEPSPAAPLPDADPPAAPADEPDPWADQDRKSTRLNSSHVAISYAVFCLKKKKRP